MLKYDYEEKTSIVNRIESLTEEKSFVDIFKIIKKDKIPYSKNKNCILINFNTVPDKTIDKIVYYLNNNVVKRKSSISIDTIAKKIFDQSDNEESFEQKKMSNYEKSVIRRSNKKLKK